MSKYQVIYEENKKLDQMFDDLYNSKDSIIFKKNKLELLVEIGEFANETKCFKYWSNKKINKELMLYEYADILIMVLSFYNYFNLEINNYDIKIDEKEDLVDNIANLYLLSTTFYYSNDSKDIKKIFESLIKIGYQINLTDEDIIKWTLEKINKNKERFQDGF